MISHSISHYQIVKKIGAGGMGEVYLAEDTRLGRKVALKLLPQKSPADEQAKKRLVREAKAAAVLDHPNICAIHEVGEDGDTSFIIMQYVEGATLSERLRAKGLTLKEAIDIAMQVADALAEAHSRGIVHRDIKPQNIIVTPRGAVKVLDFGLAKMIPQDLLEQTVAETESLITEANAIVGTAPYMSPEQIKRGRIDGRSDLFSLGAMLYECVAGRRAFTGANAMEICAQVLYVEPPAPSQLDSRVPADLDRVILKAIAKRPDARYQTAAEMLGDLQKVRDQLQAEASLPTQQVAIEPSTSRIRALATLSNKLKKPGITLPIVLAILLIAVIFFWIVPSFRPSAPYQPSPEAKRWYDEGTSGLRDGTYYQASKALERAISIDDRFALAHARLAEAWMELDYTEKAQQELLRATALTSGQSRMSSIDSLYVQAINLTATHDFEEAAGLYLRIAGQVPDAEKPYAQVDLGRAHEKNENVEKAMESYHEATRLDGQNAAGFLRLGILYGRKQEMGDAEAAFQRAGEIYQALSNVEGVAEVNYQRGLLFNSLGKSSLARPYLEQALNNAKIIDSKHQRIVALLQLSKVFYTEGDSLLARRQIDEALDLARANGMDNLFTKGLLELGNFYLARGDYGEAEKSYKQALESAQKYKGWRDEASGLLSLASLGIQLHDADGALRYVERAMSFYKQGGYGLEVSKCLTVLGRAQNLKGDYDAALSTFQQQLQHAKQLDDPFQIARGYDGIGRALNNQEKYADALPYFAGSYTTYRGIDHQLGIGYGLINQGDMQWRTGNYKESRDLLDEAVAVAEGPDGSNKRLLARISLIQAYLALSERRLAEAIAKGQQARELNSDNEHAIEARSIIGLAKSLSDKKREGRLACEEAVRRAADARERRMLPDALLALAEALIESNNAQAALAEAQKAQAAYAAINLQEPQWRTWVIAARASLQTGDTTRAREYASRSVEALSQLKQKWDAEAYQGYLRRLDVQDSLNHQSRILALSY